MITKAQLARLQTCCSQMGRHVAGYENTREARLAWAASVLQREVASFSALSVHDARRLIDQAQGELGHRAALKPGTQRKRGTPAGRRAGLDGRKGDTEFVDSPQIVSGQQIDEIASRYHRLGWSAAQYEAWLKRRSSPLKGRTTVRTNAEAQKVLWALKGMLQDAKLWVDWSAA